MRNFLTIQILILCIVTVGCPQAYAQVDTISIRNNNLQVSNLTEGTSQYLSWLRNTRSGLVSYISISERTVSFEKRNGKDVVVITKRILDNDTSKNRYVYVVCDRSCFKMLYDLAIKSNMIEAYNFNGDEITGADTVQKNTKSGFYFKFNSLPYSNELDLETISAVPVKKAGQQMAISFYQPGSTVNPAVRALNVVRSELIKSVDNASVDCWLLKLIFDSDNYDLFWVSKKTHELLKFESWEPGDVYSKVKLFNSTQNF